MSSKTATWGEIMKRKQESKFKKSKEDAADKASEVSACGPEDNPFEPYCKNNYSTVEHSSSKDFSVKENTQFDYSYPVSDYPGMSSGQTIVCQVLPNAN